MRATDIAVKITGEKIWNKTGLSVDKQAKICIMKMLCDMPQA
jgi:hypothetical protein